MLAVFLSSVRLMAEALIKAIVFGLFMAPLVYLMVSALCDEGN